MKVYVLYYSNWDESEIRGVYSEAGMKKEMANYAKYGREIVERYVAGLKPDMEYYLARAKEHFRNADAAFKQGTKASKSFGKTENKQGQIMKANAERVKMQIEKHSGFNEDKYAEFYMSKEHLSFEEYDVLE